MVRRLVVLVAVGIGLGCTTTSSPTPAPAPAPIGDGGGDGSQADAGGTGPGDSDAQGQVLACDETSDCSGDDVCCAERSGDEQRITTTCRTSCITNEPRVRVCKTDAECGPGGSCTPSPCDRGPAGLRYCERPFFCD
jgi:hypothetical protein